jgi:hypothetical protein
MWTWSACRHLSTLSKPYLDRKPSHHRISPISVPAQSHYKNSNRHNQQPIGPFSISASGTDGEVFVRSLTGWLQQGLPMLLSLFEKPDQPFAFLHPNTCKPFTVGSFCSYFKKHLFRVSKCDISPGKLRSAARWARAVPM